MLANIPVLRAREALHLARILKGVQAADKDLFKSLVAQAEVTDSEGMKEIAYLLDRAALMSRRPKT